MKKIHFTNKCKINYSWMPADEIALRENADSYILEVITTSNLFPPETEADVVYFQEGVGSIVALIKPIVGKASVFKMIKNQNKVIAEILSYKKYQEVGVAAPVIYESGEVQGCLYYIMEYFDTLTYRDLIEKGEINLENLGEYFGEILARIEKINGVGFGIPRGEEDGMLVAQKISLDDYLHGEFESMEQSHLCGQYLNTKDGWAFLVSEHIQILKSKLNDSSVLGNFDFDPRHFFASSKAILFDPDAELVPEYFSIAFFCIPEIGYPEWKLHLRRAVLMSYKSRKKNFDKEIFSSALWLLVYRKCSRLLALPDEKRITRATHMLETISSDIKFQLHLGDIFNDK